MARCIHGLGDAENCVFCRSSARSSLQAKSVAMEDNLTFQRIKVDKDTGQCINLGGLSEKTEEVFVMGAFSLTVFEELIEHAPNIKSIKLLPLFIHKVGMTLRDVCYDRGITLSLHK